MNITVKRFMRRFKHYTSLTPAQFRRYSKDNQRRIIACDALQLLLAKKIQPDHIYVNIPLGKAADNDQASQYLKQKDDTDCFVCPLGALFAGHIMALNNNHTVMAFTNSNRYDISDTLNDVFDEDTLTLIEAYYERWHANLFDNWDTETLTHMKNFADADMNDHVSMQMLLENIIEHGDFYPYEMSF